MVQKVHSGEFLKQSGAFYFFLFSTYLLIFYFWNNRNELEQKMNDLVTTFFKEESERNINIWIHNFSLRSNTRKSYLSALYSSIHPPSFTLSSYMYILYGIMIYKFIYIWRTVFEETCMTNENSFHRNPFGP